jgi:hypothetical protein
MATESAARTKQKEESADRTGALAPYRETPLSLGWMRDEFDRLLDRLSRNWPTAWTGNG